MLAARAANRHGRATLPAARPHRVHTVMSITLVRDEWAGRYISSPGPRVTDDTAWRPSRGTRATRSSDRRSQPQALECRACKRSPSRTKQPVAPRLSTSTTSRPERHIGHDVGGRRPPSPRRTVAERLRSPRRPCPHRCDEFVVLLRGDPDDAESVANDLLTPRGRGDPDCYRVASSSARHAFQTRRDPSQLRAEPMTPSISPSVPVAAAWSSTEVEPEI